MSTKDRRYYRKCPICGDTLPGTDDGLEVLESLKDQIADIDNNRATYVPNCTLCGESCSSIEEARAIVAKGEPALKRAKKEQES
jgi:hypothetical protein